MKMTDSNVTTQRLRRMLRVSGPAAFAFFAIKGIAWLTVPWMLVRMGFGD